MFYVKYLNQAYLIIEERTGIEFARASKREYADQIVRGLEAHFEIEELRAEIAELREELDDLEVEDMF